MLFYPDTKLIRKKKTIKMKMQIPTVSRCCCCVQLRTAGLIFGVLAIISFAYDIYDDNILWKQIYFGIFIVCEILWIIGILMKKPILMLPSLITDVIEQIILLFSPVYLPIYTKYFDPELYAYLQKHEQSYVKAYIFVCFVQYAALALTLYIFIVCYSLYKQIKEKVSTDADSSIVSTL